MMVGVKLEVFEVISAAGLTAEAQEIREDRLEAYEQGYRAGWEDAAAALAEDQRKIRVDLAHSLQTLNFTFHEARAYVLQALAPLMQEMVTTLLPDLARTALPPLVVEQLLPLAEGLAETPLVLAVHAQDRDAIQAELDRLGTLPVTLREEVSLAPGQVSIGRGLQEMQVDLNRALREIAVATRGFFRISDQE